MAYLLEKLILGSFASFVEDGTTFGSPTNTVGPALYPDTTTNAATWNSLGCVIDASPQTQTEDGPAIYCPDPGGGYVLEQDAQVVKDTIRMSLKCHAEPIYRLVWGVKSKLVNGTPVTPFNTRERFIRGWINFQLRGQNGSDRIIAALYGKLSIAENPTWSKDPTLPAINFEIVRSSIQSLVPAGVVPA